MALVTLLAASQPLPTDPVSENWGGGGLVLLFDFGVQVLHW